MARKRESGRMGRSAEPRPVTEDERDEAVRVITREYYQDVRGLADEIADAIRDGEITDREEFDQKLHEQLDGSRRVFITWEARLGLIASSNYEAYEEDYGEKPSGPEQAMYAAMERDVMDYLDREHHDLLNGLEQSSRA